jgi:hypothetical protein
MYAQQWWCKQRVDKVEVYCVIDDYSHMKDTVGSDVKNTVENDMENHS